MKLLIAGTWIPTPAQRAELEGMGHELYLLPHEREALPLPAEEVEGVIGNSLFLHHPIADFSALRYIQLTAAGADRLPLSEVKRRSITWHTARGVYAIPMAEFAVGALLGIYKEWDFFRAGQTLHRWEKRRGLRELFGKRVCIVGCGRVGNACAERLAAFGCVICGITAHPRRDARYECMLPPEALAEVLPTSDVVMLTLPLSEETYHLVGRRELSLLRAGSVLINLSRGKILDTEALLDALRERSLFAVLDVQETEPLPPDSPLWTMENVWITPHNSFAGEGNAARLWSVIRTNVAAWAKK